MNTQSPSLLALRRIHIHSRRGVALLLVLGCLVLLTTLILAFLISGQANLKSSKLYADGSSVKTLADSTVSLVMAQIQQATSNGTKVAWASQPGMIRTYDNTGAALMNYRLFSWDTPTVAGTYDVTTDAGLLESTSAPWYSSPALYIDLNKPVADSSGIPHFPIIDGSPTDLSTYTTPSNASAYTYKATTTGTAPAIEGFWVNAYNSGVGPAVSGANTSSSTPTANIIPMPVKWLYVLKDGTVAAPAAGAIGTQVKVNAASATNPIVGRIAYWTDDETSKVNINTASEGVYWDTPRADTNFEKNNLALNQPAQNEFQRYPGHPATTSLSTVLGSLTGFQITYPPSSASPYYTASQYHPYYALNPKLNLGAATGQSSNLGSDSATVPPVTNYGKSSATGNGAMSFKADRLYASVDELAFQSDLANGLQPTSLPGGTGVTASSGYARTSASNGVNSVIATASTNASTSQFLEKARFFLTTDSRAPDVNLFNQPRITIWPINANGGSYRTTFDNTIAFCGTINQLPYYFQRQSSYSATNDLPTSYTSGAKDISRNRALIQYLQGVTQNPVPGFGGDFVTKYTLNERNQILTEIFDYCRSQNLEDPNLAATFAFASAPAGQAGAPPSNNYLSLGAGGYTTSCGPGQVVPISDASTATRGFGRFPTITEANLIFIVLGWNDNSAGHPSTSDPNYTTLNGTAPWGYYGTPTGTTTAPCWNFSSGPGVLTTTPIAPGHVRVQAALIMTMFDPSQGYPANNGLYQIQISGMDKWTWNGTSMGFPAATTSPVNALTNWPVCSSAVYGWNQEKWGGNLDFRAMINQMSPTQGRGTFKYYPFFSNSIDVAYNPGSAASSTNPTAILFNNGTGTTNPITINMCMPTVTSYTPGTVVQSIKLNFPGASFPCPVYAGPVTDGSGTGDMGRFDIRFGHDQNPYSPQSFLFSSKDVSRSVRFNTDARLIAGLQTVDASSSTAANASYFTSYTGNETVNLMHSMWLSTGLPLYGASLGQLVNGLTYLPSGATNPYNGNAGSMGTMVSSGYCATQGAFLYNAGSPPTPTTNLGDWDNGVGVTGDGPYINKADEGNFTYWDSISGACIPYYTDWYTMSALANPGQTFFSPNRLMPSPVMFGSLPTGVIRGLPWQTLLFNPNPAGGNTHPGFGRGSGTQGPTDVPPYTSPPDHLFLDLFNMPVVEPYPITEPLSTAGRVNMNYQIVPFTYIERSTGVRAVLKSERITAIPDTDVQKYKNISGATNISYTANNYRLPINLDQTLLTFDNYFTTNKDIFRSASQICNISLVPTVDADGTPIGTPFNPTTFWATHRLTGDNTREKPYADIYPRLTTKSNTYTVHYYVQTLKKIGNSDPVTWDENSDIVTGEYRGSTTIERYVDPHDTSLPDFATSGINTALDNWYKFRVVSTKQFTP